jgi:hypothetical protein
MTEAEIYSGFNGKWLKITNEYFVAKESALAFLSHVAKNNIRVLGIEGFHLNSGTTLPVMEQIADFSAGNPTKESLHSFFESAPSNVSHYSFVLEV